MLMYNIMV